jgi:hypothetical protein
VLSCPPVSSPIQGEGHAQIRFVPGTSAPNSTDVGYDPESETFGADIEKALASYMMAAKSKPRLRLSLTVQRDRRYIMRLALSR